MASSRKRAEKILPRALGDLPDVASFADALRGNAVAIIAEIKRQSPSRGKINPAIDSGRQALAYQTGGAAAVSVLTEPSRFGGSNEDLRAARAACGLPLLRKDFLVHSAQLLEARWLGASAALLIVRAIEPARIRGFAVSAAELGLELLYEVRTESELATAVESGARIIGVNNRDLETLVVDPTTVERIVPLIPSECIAVAESGYSTRAEIETAASAGADAVLVGSAVSAAQNPTDAVAALTGMTKIARKR